MKRLVILLLLLFVPFVLALDSTSVNLGYTPQYPSSASSTYYTTGGINNPNTNAFGYQYSQPAPNFNSYYSSSQVATYWPILQDMQRGNCQAATDFMVMIAPGGCSPLVVRSDLLEEQNVPVFCQLTAVRINPLIKVSSLKSISFKGQYPAGVADVSFHPAQAAIRSYSTLLGSPVMNNIGYVVIVLKKNSVENKMPSNVEGNLTATIFYDADNAFGTGRAEYYLPVMSDAEWQIRYQEFSFWNGKGFVRLNQLDNGTARLMFYSDKDTVVKQIDVKEGQTTNDFYMPGFYCRAGLNARVNSVVGPEDQAKLNVDGDVVWVRKGSRFLNDKCTVRDLTVASTGVGSVIINCGSQSFTLVVDKRGANIVVNDAATQEFKVGNMVYEGVLNYNDWSGPGSSAVEKPTTSKKWYLTYTGKVPAEVKDVGGSNFIILIDSDKELTNAQVSAFSTKMSEYKLTNNPTRKDFENFFKSVSKPVGNSQTIFLYDKSDFNKNSALTFSGVPTDSGEKSYTPTTIDKNYAAGYQGVLLEEYFQKADDVVRYMIDTHPNDKVDDVGINGPWTEGSLWDEIILAGNLKKYDTQQKLVQQYIQLYPSSKNIFNAQALVSQTGYDIRRSSVSVDVTNTQHTISVSDFKKIDPQAKEARISLTGPGYMTVHEGELKYVDSSNPVTSPYLEIVKINPNSIDVIFHNRVTTGSSTTDKTERATVALDNSYTFKDAGRSVGVSYINVEQYAYVSLIPKVDNTKTEANFTFNIAIEKRAIELSPDKTEEMIKNLNDTIEKWDSANQKLAQLIKGWKGACFATSALLMVKSWASGMDGQSMARQEIMKSYRDKCTTDAALKTMSRTQCYNNLSKQINSDVEARTKIINNVNQQIQSAEKSAGITKGGGLFSEDVVNEDATKKILVGQIQNDPRCGTNGGVVVGQTKDSSEKTIYNCVPRDKITDYSSIQAILTTQDPSFSKLSPDAQKYYTSQKESLLTPTYNQYLADQQITVLRDRYKGLGISGQNDIVNLDNYISDKKTVPFQGGKIGLVQSQLKNTQSKDATDYQIVKQGGAAYLVTLQSNPLSVNEKRPLDVYVLDNDGNVGQKIDTNNVVIPKPSATTGNCQARGGTCRSNCNPGESPLYGYTDPTICEGDEFCCMSSSGSSNDQLNAKKIMTGYTFVSGGACSNVYKSPVVRYFETDPNKGMPSIVPFDLKNGWYAKVNQGVGGFLSNVQQGYKASGQVTTFYICNVGADGKENNGVYPDDICQSFDINTYANVKSFMGCPSMQPNEIRALAERAQEAIRQAAQNYGKKGTIKILGQDVTVGAPAGTDNGAECQDFMSPEDCMLLFNVCDPVICPSSRCNLGGAYSVPDVVQTGIIGSILLCLPNWKEGVMVPVCLTGINAGIDSLVSILKSERACLQKSLEAGEHVGICDEITSVYLCEFFWRQLAPVMNILIPKMIEASYGGGLQGARGGGEYMTVMNSWNTLQNNMDYFKNTYAQNSFKAFDIRNVEQAGGTFCRAFIGTSLPTSASILDNLLAPESPEQIYAWFAETPYTEATVPATSQYKVYYHIYAGKDQGTQFQVYLKNPPASSYYNQNQQIYVKAGYIAKGESADETVDFTAPAGYKEMCVVVNAQEHCGFKQVTTDFALNYMSQNYVAQQANTTNIQTEKECLSGTPSLLAATTPNIQSGLEQSAQPSIAMNGIIRVCATANPGANVEIAAASNSVVNGIGTSAQAVQQTNDRWKQVGYCGNPNIRCWLDTNSVATAVTNVQKIDNSIAGMWNASAGVLTGDKKADFVYTEDQTNSILDNIQKKIETNDKSQVLRKSIDEILKGSSYDYETLKKSIDTAVGVNQVGGVVYELENLGGSRDVSARGYSNMQVARALSLKAKVYMIITQALKDSINKATPDVPIVSTNANTPTQTTTTTTTTTTQPSTVHDGFFLNPGNKIFLGDPISSIESDTGLYIKGSEIYLNWATFDLPGIDEDVKLASIRSSDGEIIKTVDSSISQILNNLQPKILADISDLAKNYEYIGGKLGKKTLGPTAGFKESISMNQIASGDKDTNTQLYPVYDLRNSPRVLIGWAEDLFLSAGSVKVHKSNDVKSAVVAVQADRFLNILSN